MWLPVLSWYLVVGLLGLLAFPLAYRLLPALPDRGYAFARVLALLVWGLAYWLLGSYGALANNHAGLLAALLVLLGLAFWAWRGLSSGELRAWLKANRGYILKVEVLFLLAFVAMVLYRAHLPQAVSTEKPMELAFINSILASSGMPPNDPWLSGYAISYYYFGYVIVGMLAMVSGVAGAVAFNLALSLVFALGAVGAYGLVYNLLALRHPGKAGRSAWLAFLAPVFVLVLGNLEGLLEVLHAQHLLGPWLPNAEGLLKADFWSWLDILDLNQAPLGDPSWMPRNYGTGSWWWWRASRVINDVNFLGGQQELIDEFPAFSFVLGDLHPHVLSIPFVLLTLGAGLNFFRSGDDPQRPAFLGLFLSPIQFAFIAVLLGGLAFLNIWDFPIYLVFFAILYALREAQASGWAWARLSDLLGFALALGAAAILLYLPFFLGFSSQAGGILPNLLNPSRGAHLWVMFGTLFPFVIIYLLYQWRRSEGPRRLGRGLLLALGFVLALWLLSLGAAWLLGTVLSGSDLGEAILSGLGAPDLNALLAESLSRRLMAIGGVLSMVLLLGLVVGQLWPLGEGGEQKRHPRESVFVLILALVATLLIIAPEFIYLRDHFGTRMNTVFKFYYQAWILFGLVAAYGAAVLLVELRAWKGTLFSVGFVALLAAGLLYPAFAFSDRVIADQQPLSLDGAIRLSADQRAAVDWLNQQPRGVLVEATGPQYSDFARYATHTIHNGVLGWAGHEGQWRGNSVNYGPRIGDIETLYRTAEWETARAILEQYGVDYVVVGNLERQAYVVAEEKFQAHLPVAFQNAEVTIYRLP